MADGRLENRVAETRKRRGMPAAVLAEAAGLSRQTIYAIEAGNYVPNTAAALRIARALGATVEELFVWAGDGETGMAPIAAVSLDLEPSRTAVQLHRVHSHVVATSPASGNGFLFPSDARVVAETPETGALTVQPYDSQWNKTNALVIAGCDPALSFLARALEANNIHCVLVNTTSHEALQLLARGSVHAAGLHLLDDESGEYNVPFVRRIFPAELAVLLTFADAEHGLAAAPGNPLRISAVADLGDGPLRFANRPPGSGSRDLLDRELARHRVPITAVRGYDCKFPGQMAVAEAVANGEADCGIVIRSAALAYNLHFVRLASQRFDICIPQRTLDLPAGRALADALNSLSLRRVLAAEADYDVRGTGGRRL